MLINLPEFILIILIAFLLIGFMYLPGIKVGINLADEGYLWYGAQRVLAGEIPIRDFRAYDPGRYYWCAIWMRFLGAKLLSLRMVLLFTQLLALSAAMVLVNIVSSDWYTVIFAGLAVAIWMFPIHKQVDILFSLITPLIAVLWVTNPGESLYLIAGIYICVCLFFGLNHAIYSAAAFFLLVFVLSISGHGLAMQAALLWFGSGLFLGLIPVAIFYYFVPGLLKVYWQHKVRRIYTRGSANLRLPIPWLWASDVPQLTAMDPAAKLVIKILFSLMPVIYITIIIIALLLDIFEQKLKWSLIAIAFCGLFYMHHAYSRADLSHLAQSIAPFVLCIVLLSNNFSYGWVMVVIFIAISLRYIFWPQCSWLKHILGLSKLQKHMLDNTNYYIPQQLSNYIDGVMGLIEKHTKPGDAVLLLPTLVTFYPLSDRVPAVYDLFSVYPATVEEENAMIGEIEYRHADFVLINNCAIDGRESLRFSQTHPVTWQYIKNHFKVFDNEVVPDEHIAMIRNR